MEKLDTKGYLHPNYTQSASEFGKLLQLPRSGAWLLVRPIPGFEDRYFDAMTIYPHMFCKSWEGLEQDLDELEGVVSVVTVPDPYGLYSSSLLKSCFPDKCDPRYKLGLQTDLSLPLDQIGSKRRKKAGEKALKKLQIEISTDPTNEIDEFHSLYDCIIQRHHIDDMRAFSKHSIQCHLNTPGLVYIKSIFEGETVAVHTWMLMNRIAYAHLAAHSKRGYELSAPSALYRFALDYFKPHANWLFLGGAATGSHENHQEKLLNFKRGWASGDLEIYLCGRILNSAAYWKIANSKNIDLKSSYFPIYRQGEF